MNQELQEILLQLAQNEFDLVNFEKELKKLANLADWEISLVNRIRNAKTLADKLKALFQLTPDEHFLEVSNT